MFAFKYPTTFEFSVQTINSDLLLTFESRKCILQVTFFQGEIWQILSESLILLGFMLAYNLYSTMTFILSYGRMGNFLDINN